MVLPRSCNRLSLAMGLLARRVCSAGCLVVGIASLGIVAEARERPFKKDSYKLEDGNRQENYVVATNELAERQADGRWRVTRLPIEGSADELRRRAADRRKETGSDAEVILYPAGKPHTGRNRRVLRGEVVFRISGASDPRVVAESHGLAYEGQHRAAAGFFVARASDPGEALEAAEELRADKRVLWVQPQVARQMARRFTPNDTYFAQQWHLLNTGQGGGTVGVDANLSAVWDSYRGAGILIGVVDDGLPTDHPDLTANVDTANDHDWNDATPNDPTPNVANEDFHGAAVAGIVGARGNNGMGVCGVAPEATLVGLRLISGDFTDSDEADATGWKKNLIPIKNNSWGPDDLGDTLVGPGTLMAAALEDAVNTGRGGKGTVIPWAGGNGAEVNDNSNYDGYANSVYVIAVGALGNDGKHPAFSEPGANLAVVAPSAGGTLKMVTTDLQGNDGYNTSTTSGDLSQRAYTNSFGGTSAATPVVSGICALMLQANPNLGWRDVKEILIRTARKCDAADADWVSNGAGIHFNHKYGAGLVDAQAAVNWAQSWINLPVLEKKQYAQTGLSVNIPNNNAAGVTRSFSVSEPAFRVEQATVKVNLTHPGRGDLEIILTSPSGVQSRLAEPHNDANADMAPWTFSSMRYWGESASGTWTVKVADRKAGNGGGILKAVTLSLFGSPQNQPPQVTAGSIVPSESVFVGETLSLSGVNASDAEGNSLTLSYRWQQSDDGTTFTDIASATFLSFIPGAVQSGKAVRCQITASDAMGSGSPFNTAVVDIRQQPSELAHAGQSYSFDCDLYIPGGIGNYRLAPGSDTVPGLSINPQTGILEGVVNQQQNGFYSVSIERFQGASFSVVQTFTLLILDSGGTARIPAGKTFQLRRNLELGGDISVEGSLDTAGFSLTIPGTLNVTGTVNNPSGTIAYLSRDGVLPGGTISLISDPVNDLADTDGDGLPNVLEFVMGTNPRRYSPSIAVGRLNGRNTLTFTTPVGAVGVTPIVEVSNDLVNWQSGAGATAVLSNQTVGPLRTITVQDRSTGSQRYIRLKATR